MYSNYEKSEFDNLIPVPFITTDTSCPILFSAEVGTLDCTYMYVACKSGRNESKQGT